MIAYLSDELADVFRRATREPLIALEQRPGAAVLGLSEIESYLPHRDPFLFLDCVTMLDVERGLIAARYDLSRGQVILAGHFPGRPVWPGVLQVEAVAQAGGLLCAARTPTPEPVGGVLAHILAARFMHPVTPGADLDILACVVDDGLLTSVVGQCVQTETICSVAAVSIL